MKEYVKGNGSYCVLAKKYGVPSKKQVHIWVTAYKKWGGRYNQGWGYQMKEYIHNLKENKSSKNYHSPNKLPSESFSISFCPTYFWNRV